MLKLKTVDSIPVLGKRHDLQALIEEFAKSNCEVMEVEFEMGSDYKNAVVCRSCLSRAKTSIFRRLSLFSFWR